MKKLKAKVMAWAVKRHKPRDKVVKEVDEEIRRIY
jgi:hypothetical protein